MKILFFLLVISSAYSSSLCESIVKAEVIEIVKQGKERVSFKFRVLNSKQTANKSIVKCELKTFSEDQIEVDRNQRTFITGEIVNLKIQQTSALSESGVVTSKSWSLL